MGKNLFNIIILVFFTGCQTPVKKTIFPSTKVFPDGIYRQSIQLMVLKDGKPQDSFPFDSISKVEKGTFETLGLSPFGTTVFEAKGSLLNLDQLNLKFFVKVPSFVKTSFVKSVLSQISHIYSLKKIELKKDGEIDTYQKGDLILRISSYTKEKIPKETTIQTKKWKSYVQTQSYKKNY